MGSGAARRKAGRLGGAGSGGGDGAAAAGAANTKANVGNVEDRKIAYARFRMCMLQP